MKLYTEEQVKMAIQMGDKYHYLLDIEEDGIIKSLTHIELPSDEEIEKAVNCSNLGLRYDYSMSAGFKKGAKWMRDKLKGGNK